MSAVKSRWRRRLSLSCFWPPRQSCKPARSAVMVFVLAWLPLALDTDLYYPAGSRFITAVLLSSANFLFLFSPCLLQRLPKRVQGLNHFDDVTFLKWAGTPVRHISHRRKNIDLYFQGWVAVNELKLFFFSCFINENDFRDNRSWHSVLSPWIYWKFEMKSGRDQWHQVTSSL